MRFLTSLARYLPLFFGILGLIVFIALAFAFGGLWPPRLVPLTGVIISVVLIACNLPYAVNIKRRGLIYGALLGVYSAGVLYMGLRPKSWNRIRRFHVHNVFSTEASPEDVLMNVIGFIPLGFLLAVVLLTMKREWSAKRAFAVSTAACGLVSLGIETSQIFIGGRTSSLVDLVTNVAGAALGAVYALVFVRLWDGRSRSHRSEVQTSPTAVAP